MEGIVRLHEKIRAPAYARRCTRSAGWGKPPSGTSRFPTPLPGHG